MTAEPSNGRGVGFEAPEGEELVVSRVRDPDGFLFTISSPRPES